MRLLWLLGCRPSLYDDLVKNLKEKNQSHLYFLRKADHVDDIPEEHFNHESVSFLVNAQNPNFLGLSAVEMLRKTGPSKSKIILLGELSHKDLNVAFLKFKINFHIADQENIDIDFLAGLLLSHALFQRDLDVKHFLSPLGKANHEVIQSLQEYNMFGSRLIAFLKSRQIDVSKLKKILMGLGLVHIKNENANVGIDSPFPVYFGIDEKKLVIAVRGYSKGSESEQIFSQLVHVLNSEEAHHSDPVIHPEFRHAWRAAQNFALLGGSKDLEVPLMDPLVMMNVFPLVEDLKNSYRFLGLLVSSKVSLLPEVLLKKERQVQVDLKAKEISEEPAAQDTFELPKVVGNTPKSDATVKEEKPSESKASPTLKININPKEEKELLEQVKSETPLHVAKGLSPQKDLSQDELARLQEINRMLAKDVERLMKERKVASTSAELKDKVQKLELEIKRLKTELSSKEKLISELEKKVA